jgi:hypothetical protein
MVVSHEEVFLFHEEEKEEEEVMEYLVYLADVVMLVFLFFPEQVVGGGDGIFGVYCGSGDASFSISL